MEWADYSWVWFVGIGALFVLLAIGMLCVKLDFPSYEGADGILLVCLVLGMGFMFGSVIVAKSQTYSANNRILNERLAAEYGVVKRTPNTFPGVDVFTPPDYQLTTPEGRFACRLVINPSNVEPLVQALCSPTDGTATAPSEFVDLNGLTSTAPPPS